MKANFTKFVCPRGFVKHLDELEDINAHGERLIEIAKECEKQAGAGSYESYQFRSVRECLEDNLHEHMERGSLTRDLYTIRYGLTLFLRELMGETFGPGIIAKVRP